MLCLIEAVGDLFLPPSMPTPLLSNSEVGRDGVGDVVGVCGSGRYPLCKPFPPFFILVGIAVDDNDVVPRCLRRLCCYANNTTFPLFPSRCLLNAWRETRETDTELNAWCYKAFQREEPPMHNFSMPHYIPVVASRHNSGSAVHACPVRVATL